VELREVHHGHGIGVEALAYLSSGFVVDVDLLV
jgi:hypothetical protein